MNKRSPGHKAGGRGGGECSQQKDQQGQSHEHREANGVRMPEAAWCCSEQPDTLTEGEGQRLVPALSVQSSSCALPDAECHKG